MDMNNANIEHVFVPNKIAKVTEVKLKGRKGKDDQGGSKDKVDDKRIHPSLRLFTLSLNGVTVELCNLGASVTKLLLPRSHRRKEEDERGGAYECNEYECNNYEKDRYCVEDCVLGFHSPEIQEHTHNPVFFSAVVGRVANRIAGASFDLVQNMDGDDREKSGDNVVVTYNLDANDGDNHLHGGNVGFSHKVWGAEIISLGEGGAENGVKFTLHSPDGDEGYPASIVVSATYTLVSTPPTKTLPYKGSHGLACLRLVLKASLQQNEKKRTPINLAQHSYFNLGGHNYGNGILDHKLTLPSIEYTPLNQFSIPTGEVRHVDLDQTMDFRKGKVLSDALMQFGVAKAGLNKDVVGGHVLSTKTTREEGEKFLSGDNTLDNFPPSAPYGFDHNYVIKKSIDPDKKRNKQ